MDMVEYNLYGLFIRNVRNGCSNNCGTNRTSKSKENLVMNLEGNIKMNYNMKVVYYIIEYAWLCLLSVKKLINSFTEDIPKLDRNILGS